MPKSAQMQKTLFNCWGFFVWVKVVEPTGIKINCELDIWKGVNRVGNYLKAIFYGPAESRDEKKNPHADTEKVFWVWGCVSKKPFIHSIHDTFFSCVASWQQIPFDLFTNSIEDEFNVLEMQFFFC